MKCPHVLQVDVPWVDDVVRAKRPNHLPVVLGRDETHVLISALDGVPRLMALLYLYVRNAPSRERRLCALKVAFPHSQGDTESGGGQASS